MNWIGDLERFTRLEYYEHDEMLEWFVLILKEKCGRQSGEEKGNSVM